MHEIVLPLPITDGISHVDCRDPPIRALVGGRECERAQLQSLVLLTVGRLGEIGEQLDTSERVRALKNIV
jgi:hypothetical protein